MRIISGLIEMAIGVAILWKTYSLVNIFGKVPWAEEHLRSGLGGTYFLYKLIGLAAVAYAVFHIFGYI